MIPKSVLEALKAAKSEHYDESQTKQFLILPVLAAAGWNVFDSDEVWPELKVGPKKFDFTLCRAPKDYTAVLEAKRLKTDLSVHKKQLLEYAFESGVPIAILTNGRIWWFYLSQSSGSWDKRFVCSLNLTNTEQAAELLRLLKKEHIQSGTTQERLRELIQKTTKTVASQKSVAEFLATLTISSAEFKVLEKKFSKFSGLELSQSSKILYEYFQTLWRSENRASHIPKTSSKTQLLAEHELILYNRRLSIQETSNSATAASILICIAQYASKALQFSPKLKTLLGQYYSETPISVQRLYDKYNLQRVVPKSLLPRQLPFRPKKRYSTEAIQKLLTNLKTLTSEETSPKAPPKTQAKRRL